MSSSHTMQTGAAVPTPFDSWMERATAEFFDKLASIKQPVAGNRFICRVGLEDVYFIEYGDHQGLLQALMCLWTKHGGLLLTKAEGDMYGSTWISCAKTDSPDAGLSALLCVSIEGLTYLILNDRGTVPSRSSFQQVSSPYDWNEEFNKKQGSRINQGMQSASGESKDAETSTKDFGGTANQASQSAGGGEDKGVGNNEEL